MFDVELIVTPRPGVRDPQSEAVQESLRSLGHSTVAVTAVGRVMRLRVAESDAARAEAQVRALCAELLVNPCLETFALRLEPV